MLDKLADLINKSVPEAKAEVIKPVEDGAGDSSIVVTAESIVDVTTFLRDNSDEPFNVLQVISGVDYPDYFEVNYMFARFELTNHADFILKVRIKDKSAPKVHTISHLFNSADWQERECYDMLGIVFENHPDPRRILCPDDWEGFPLRKDYVVQEVYRGMQVNPENKMNWGDRQFAQRQEKIKKAQDEAAK